MVWVSNRVTVRIKAMVMVRFITILGLALGLELVLLLGIVSELGLWLDL